MNLPLPLSSMFNKINDDWPETCIPKTSAIFRKQQKL